MHTPWGEKLARSSSGLGRSLRNSYMLRTARVCAWTSEKIVIQAPRRESDFPSILVSVPHPEPRRGKLGELPPPQRAGPQRAGQFDGCPLQQYPLVCRLKQSTRMVPATDSHAKETPGFSQSPYLGHCCYLGSTFCQPLPPSPF